MSNLRISLLTPWLVKCGVASYSFYLADALAKQDCEVYVVRLNRFGAKDEAYYRNYAEEVPLDVDIVLVEHEYGLYGPALELQFYSALKQRMMLFNKKVPIVTTLHSLGGNLYSDGVIASNSDAIIVHNETQAATFKHPTTIVPMGVQKVKEPPPSDLAKRRWGVQGKTVGMFGFLSEYKGLEIMIRAVSKLPDVTLLVGGGWHVSETTAFISNIRIYADQMAPGRVRFLGYVSEEDLASYFGACDIMVFAHYLIGESMAISTALAYGKATLASNLPAFVEKAQRKIIAVFTDADDLAGKIKALFAEPELKESLEKNAKAYALANSWQSSAEKHISLFESLMK